MEISLNGESRRIEDGTTLQGLVGMLQLPDRALAIAVNRKVITRAKWPEVVLQPGDRVELVRAIGGGCWHCAEKG